MMKTVYCLLCCCFFIFDGLAADSLTILSPDKSILVNILAGNTLSYTVFADNKCILLPSVIDLLLKDGRRLSDKPAVQSTAVTTVNQNIVSPVPEKKINISDHYNQLFIHFKQAFCVIFRVYNDGVAYRIITRFKDSIFIKQEIAGFNFPPGSSIIAPVMQQRTNEDKYHTSFEELYVHKPMDSLARNSLMYSPLLIDETNIKIALTESDLDNYPGMFLKATGGFSLTADFAPFRWKKQLLTKPMQKR